MSDNQWDSTKARLSIAVDLSEIVRMFAALKLEAVNRAGDPDIPGGMAMVLLGPGADVEAFGYAQMSELMGRTHKRVWLPNKGDVEPPLSYLASWNDIIRDARGIEPSTKRALLMDEVESIRHALDWMLSVNDDGEPWFMQVEDFADGLRKVRRAMENVLHDGERQEWINAKCRACDKHPRLIREPGPLEDGSLDNYRCPNCDRSGGREWVAQCWHWMVGEKGDPPEWVTVKVAAAATGRSPKTIHRWTEPRVNGSVKVRKREGETTEIEVNWEDVRIAHDTAAHRPWQTAS